VMFMESSTVYCKKRMEPTERICSRHVSVRNIKISSTPSHHLGIKPCIDLAAGSERGQQVRRKLRNGIL
jgi:hypothetical protein